MISIDSASVFLGWLAMAPPAGNGQAPAPWYVTMFPLFLLVFAFYFAILRPQQKRQKQHDLLMKSLKAGDKVSTTGGLMGTVVTVKERSVSLRSGESKLEVLKTSIAEIAEREPEGAAGAAQS